MFLIDSHIHLFPQSHLPTLAWYSSGNPLASQHSVHEYRIATAGPVRGFIFLETDRISSVQESEHSWAHVLDEVSLLTRIALGQPIPGEGHDPLDASLCLGIIPWAPVPGGPAVLEKYMGLVKQRTQTDAVWKKVRGIRYLVQDKPAGTMLEPQFVDGLKWLGKKGFTFDLGVDARQGGLWQLREAVEMMGRVYEDAEATFVVTLPDHLCKPNLRLSGSVAGHPDFVEWKSLVTSMARFPRAYMKLSGGFSELPPLGSAEPDIPSLVERLHPWTDVIFDTFGPERVMFGSDWPVCNIGGGGNEVSWRRWQAVVEQVLDRRGLSHEQKAGVWGQTAIAAYGIDI